MQRKVRKTPHTTLTEVAARAAKALRGARLLPYPGVINPKRTRGAPRVVITAEANRIKIGVAGHGHQELMLYGAVNRDTVVVPLVREFGLTNVTVRDPHGVWCAPSTIQAPGSER